MSHQPLGSFGADIDMVDGRPLVTPDQIAQKRHQAEAGLDRAILESAELAEELRAHPQMLRVLADLYLKRLEVLALQDDVCLTVTAAFGALNERLDLIPHLRSRQMRLKMGGLQQFLKEDEEPPAAL